jgi:hypothetical protein
VEHYVESSLRHEMMFCTNVISWLRLHSRVLSLKKRGAGPPRFGTAACSFC